MPNEAENTEIIVLRLPAWMKKQIREEAGSLQGYTDNMSAYLRGLHERHMEAKHPRLNFEGREPHL